MQRPVKALDRLGPYELVAPLGEGGMGEVWKARDTRLDRTVALKFSKARFEERFQYEARAVAALNHPHIGALYDVGPDYLVMELVEGSPLRGPMPIGKALVYASQILEALDAAHRKGIVHRDLKPANILVTAQGIKLLDFGLAKRQPLEPTGDATLTKALTEEGQIVGTLQYMAPEQLQGRPADARSDLFAFGCVLYEMLTGKYAFDGASKASVIAAILEREPAPLAVDPALERIVRTCLAKNPDDRFQNAADLKRNLLWAVEPQAVTPVRRGPSRFLATSILTAVCLLLGLALVWTLFRPPQTHSLPATKLNRITRDGQSYGPALSPDGKLVAYASRRAGSPNEEIYVQQLTGEGTVRLTDHPAADVYPEFSADGSKVYFVSTREPAGIYEVPALGGDARLLVAIASSPAASPDGKWLAYVLEDKVFLRSLTTGDTRALEATLDPRLGRVVWSPDSSRVAILNGLPSLGGSLQIVPLDGMQPETLAFGANLKKRGMFDMNLMSLVGWLPTDQLVFTAPFGNTENVWTLPIRSAGAADPAPVTLGPLGEHISASVRGGRVAFTDNRNINVLWQVPADLDAGRLLGQPRQLTFEKVSTLHQDASVDGKLLAWSSRRAGSQGIWIRDISTGKERLLVGEQSDRSGWSHLQFSRDGSKIASTFSDSGAGGGRGAWRLRVVDVATGQWRELTKRGGRIRGWSPDGRYLVVWNLEQGENVAAVDVSTGDFHIVLSHASSPIRQPRLSPDGRWIVFMKDEAIYVAPFRGKQAVAEREWIEVARGSSRPFWSPNGGNLYYVTNRPGAPDSLQIARQPFDSASGKPVGAPAPFQSLEGRVLSNPITNQIVGTPGGIVVAFVDSASDIWAMDLPR